MVKFKEEYLEMSKCRVVMVKYNFVFIWDMVSEGMLRLLLENEGLFEENLEMSKCVVQYGCHGEIIVLFLCGS